MEKEDSRIEGHMDRFHIQMKSLRDEIVLISDDHRDDQCGDQSCIVKATLKLFYFQTSEKIQENKKKKNSFGL